MYVSTSQRQFFALFFLLLFTFEGNAQTRRRRPPVGGRVAVIVDERLSALRDSPSLSGRLIQRLGRGRFVAITGQKSITNGIVFYRVRVTSRTVGWIQREAVVSTSVAADDDRLMRLIMASEEFDRIARGRIFLDTFTHSSLRPAVLLAFGDAAEAAAVRLSREAGRRLDAHEMNGNEAPEFSYFLNYNGLDRYNRQGVRFVFDSNTKQFHYNGAAWREIISRYKHSLPAIEARKRLASLATKIQTDN
jgi:hypothetical protein